MLSATDKYLINAIKGGDQKAFECLFKTYYPDLCKFAGNIVKVDTIAEDLVMDIFVKLWEAGNDLSISSSIGGYLFTSVHNHCINYLTRKHKRFVELKPETVDNLNLLVTGNNNKGPMEGIDLAALSQRIQACIDQLPEECQKIFLMSRADELANKEIAARLGISENTVKAQIYRALKKFKLVLKDYLAV